MGHGTWRRGQFRAAALFAMTLCAIGLCARALPSQLNPAPSDTSAAPVPGWYSAITLPEVILAATVLIFGLVMSILAGALLRRTQAKAEDVIRLFALIVIVCGILFLIAAGYSSSDIAPSLGLLGTIAGYLLGRSASNQPAPAPTRPEDAIGGK